MATECTVTDRLAAGWLFPASNLHSERDCQWQERRLRIAQISQENFMELIGHLPTEEATACKHARCGFNMLHVSKSLSHTAIISIIDSFQFILLCGCYTVSIRCSRYAVGCSSFGPVILVQEDSVDLDSAAEAGPQPNRPTETSCHLLVPSHIKR